MLMRDEEGRKKEASKVKQGHGSMRMRGDIHIYLARELRAVLAPTANSSKSAPHTTHGPGEPLNHSTSHNAREPQLQHVDPDTHDGRAQERPRGQPEQADPDRAAAREAGGGVWRRAGAPETLLQGQAGGGGGGEGRVAVYIHNDVM